MLGCDKNNLSVDQILMNLLAKDSNGNCSLRLIEVVDGDAPYKDCDLANISAQDLFKLIVGVDGSGKLGLRVILGTASADDCVDCANSNLSFEDLLTNHVIGLGDDGLPALRLATV